MSIFSGPSQKALNEIDNTINASMDSYNSSIQGCTTSGNQNIDVEIKGCDGNVVFSGNTVTQGMDINSSCVSTTKLNNSQNMDIINKFTQSASNVMAGLGIEPVSQEAQNVTRSYVKMAMSVINILNQQCTIITQQSQLYNIDDTGGKSSVGAPICGTNATHGNIVFTNNNLDQTMKTVLSCVQNSDVINTQKSQISTTIDQIASNSFVNIGVVLAGIIILGIIILLLGGVVGGKDIIKSLIWPIFALVIFLIALACAYFSLAYNYSWWPFKKTTPDDRGISDYSWPTSFSGDTDAKKGVLLIAYSFSQCQSDSNKSSWQNIRKLLFPNTLLKQQDGSITDDLVVANNLIQLNGDILSQIQPVGYVTTVPNTSDGCNTNRCGDSCKICLGASLGNTSMCEAECVWNQCIKK